MSASQPSYTPPEATESDFSMQVDGSAELLLRIAMTGDLDLVGGSALRSTLGALGTLAPFVVLDLRGVTFCDAAGVHVILEAAEAAHRRGDALVILPAPPPVHRVFELTDSDRRLAFVTEPDGPRVLGAVQAS